MRHLKLLSLALLLFTLALAATPMTAYAEEFFDSPVKVTKLIDG